MPDRPAEPEPTLTREQVTAFAAGLRYIATCDGVHPEELRLIREFVADAGCPDLASRLDELDLDPVLLARALDSTWHRRLFLKTAILLVRADGKISSEERAALSWIGGFLGVTGALGEIEREVEALALDAPGGSG